MLEVSERDIIDRLSAPNLKQEHIKYLNFHAKRLAYAVNWISAYRERKPLKKLLDIGPHFLTRCICEFFPDVEVSTLGWKLEELVPEGLYIEHIQFDLNDCGSLDIVSAQAPFDLIVFSETIEHLYTSPAVVLPVLKELLAENGAVFIQTPNAVTLRSRWALLRGRNPYHLIREERTNPGHFREYTKEELTDYSIDSGFSVCEAEYCSYWVHPIPLIRFFENSIPSFRQGMSFLIENK